MWGWLSRRFGMARPPAGWRLIDPRPTIAENPYTFFVPSEVEKAALQPGDIIKMLFESLDPKEGVERMWVIFGGRDTEGCFGKLDNEPFSISGLTLGDEVRFQDYHVVAVHELKLTNKEAQDEEDRFFARCRVERAILAGTAKIALAERQAPRDEPGVTFPDTGWHFYASDPPGVGPDELQFVAVGVVLNRDDSMLGLLDEAVGTVVRCDPNRGLLALPPESS